MVVGGSGSMKTTFLLQMLHEWEQGHDVLGYKSHPCDWAYIACDRHMWEADKTLCRIGLADWDAPIFSTHELFNFGTGFTIEDILHHDYFRPCKLIVIEGLQALIPDTRAGQAQNKVELNWMNAINKFLFETGKTVILVTHNPKMKTGEKFASDRADVLGSVSIGASTSTMIHVREVEDKQNPDTDKRIVTLNGRDFKAFSVLYDVDPQGRLVNPTTDTVDVIAAQTGKMNSISEHICHNNMDLWLTSLPVMPMKASDILTYGDSVGYSRSSVYRWIDSASRRGLMKKIDYGVYMKVIELEENSPLQ